MPCTVRAIAPLIRSLLFGAAVASGLSVVTVAAVGCSDEGDPATHVKRLDDPGTRPAAANRLVQFFEDAMTRDNKDRNGPTVKPLLDQIVEPMSKVCVAGDSDERTQSKIVKFLSDARDPRGEPCLEKVLKDWKPEGGNEEDVRWAARGVGGMKVKTGGGPLLEVFLKLRPSKLKKVPELYRDVSDALEDVADPGWESQLIGLLNHPIGDKKDAAALRDEVYWQATSAKLLGILKSTTAVKPLIKTVLSPNKADVALTSINALIKIGKPAIGPTLALLKGQDNELVEYSKTENLKGAQDAKGQVPESAKKQAETAHIGAAAIILAAIGREESAAPMIESIAHAPDDLSRAVIARELPKLPKTPEVVKAFQDAFEKTPATLSIPPGQGARESLLEEAGKFFDSSMVPWMVRTAMATHGEDSDVDPIRAASLVTAMKLMTNDQIGTVEGLYNAKATGPDGKPSTLGKAYEKEYKIAKELLSACSDKLECYLAKLAEPTSQVDDTQFQGIKSAYMAGVYGGPDVRQKLIDLMPKLTNPAVRFAAVSIIDRFSPKGDPAIAQKLQKIVDDAEASKDSNKIAVNAPFKMIIYRLNARAQ